MTVSVLSIFALLVTTSSAAIVPIFERDVCIADQCAKAVTGSCRGPSAVLQAQYDCSAFQQLAPTTISGPSTTITVTSSAEITNPTVTLESTVTATGTVDFTTLVTTTDTTSTNSKKSSTLLTTATSFSTGTRVTTTSTEVFVHTSTVVEYVTTTVDSLDPTVVINQKRVVSTGGPLIPPYASVCADIEAYASACSCWGILPVTLTLPGETEIATETISSTALPTESDVTTVLTSVSNEATSIATLIVTATSVQTVVVDQETTRTLPVTVIKSAIGTTTSTTSVTSTAVVATATSDTFILQSSSNNAAYNGYFLGKYFNDGGDDFGWFVPVSDSADATICELSSTSELICDNDIVCVFETSNGGNGIQLLDQSTFIQFGDTFKMTCQITNGALTCDPIQGRSQFGLSLYYSSFFLDVTGEQLVQEELPVTLNVIFV